jgi:hypothetical protein
VLLWCDVLWKMIEWSGCGQLNKWCLEVARSMQLRLIGQSSGGSSARQKQSVSEQTVRRPLLMIGLIGRRIHIY